MSNYESWVNAMELNQHNFLQIIHQQNLQIKDNTLLIAVSGGVDSLALLHLLVQLRERFNLHLHAATLDHSLRPDSTDDAAFVQSLSQKWDVPFSSKQVNVQALAQSQQIGIEAAGRQARYDFLADVARKIDTKLILTAHHADDQSETVFMHLLRGTGIQGLIGMRPEVVLPDHPDLILLRPLLSFRRQQIEAYCTQYALEPRLDQSNFNTDFLRNHVRHDILPRLRQLNPQFDSILNQLADIVSVEQDYMQQQSDTLLKPHIQLGETVLIKRSTFLTWHPALQRRAILSAIQYLQVETSYQHIQHAIDLATNGKQGAIAQFPNHIHLRIDYDMLKIEHARQPAPLGKYLQIQGEYSVKIPGETKLENWKLIASNQFLPDSDAQLCIPDDAMLGLRTRRAGDRLKPMGMKGHSQKLKKWLIDHKIPQNVRDSLAILTVNDTIAAILLPQQWLIAEEFMTIDNSQCNIYFKIINQD
jgi:tRNA(Ile)-lysidine synthase